MSKCVCGYYQKSRHHTRIGGGDCEHYIQQAEIDALKQRVRELEEAQRWIPVSERLPDKGQHVITFSGDMLLPFNVDCLTVGHVWFFQDGLPNPVTHWMPLPEPPEAGE